MGEILAKVEEDFHCWICDTDFDAGKDTTFGAECDECFNIIRDITSIGLVSKNIRIAVRKKFLSKLE